MKIQNRLPYLALLTGLAALLAALLAVPSQGAIQYADSAAYATPTWDTGINFQWGNLSGGPYSSAWGTGNDAVFEGTAGLITIGPGGVTAHSLYFTNVSGYIITNSAGSALTLNASTPTITTWPGLTATISARMTGAAGLAVAGGGTLNLTTSTNNFTAGNFDIGTATASNTVNVSEGGRLIGAAGITLNVGSSTFGGNRLNVSTPGTFDNMSIRAYQLNLGTSSSDNEINISNGAYYGVLSSGNAAWNIGANAGANNNRLIVTGTGTILTRSGSQGSGIQIGGAGDSNCVQILAGAYARTIRLSSLGSAGGDYNYMLISGSGGGTPSTWDGTNYTQMIFNVGASAGAVGNSFRVENGGRALNVGTNNNQTSRDFTVGWGVGSSNNYVLIKDSGSTMNVMFPNPLVIGGKIVNGAASPTIDDTTLPLNNHIDIYSGGALTIAATTSLYLMGVDSAFNLGDGVGVSTSTVGANGGAIVPGVFLKNASALVNFNSGRLIASADAALISGLGKAQLNGPAWLSTTFVGSIISSEITGSGSLTKEGTGKLLLTLSNSYSGLTTISNGVLQAAVTNSLGTGDLNIITGAKLEVPAGVMVSAAALQYDGVVQSPGTYGATGSGAAVINDTYFTGTGILNVLGGTVLPLRITGFTYDANNDQLILKWDSSPGAVYTIENTQNLVDWDNLTTGISAGGITTTRLIDFPQPGTFYRIRKE